MVEGGMKCVKYLLFGFNLIFVLVAIGLIAVGVYVHVAFVGYTHALDALDAFKAAAIFIIVVGLLIFFIAFFGCCGAIRENRFCILMFAILLIIILVLEIAGAIAGYVLKGQVEDDLKKYTLTNKENRDFWDKIQKEFACCGIEGPKDWKNGTTIPKSCCKEQDTDCTANSKTLNQNGCINIFVNWVKDRVGYVAGVALGFTFLQVAGITFACCLAVAIKKEYEVL